MHQVLFHIPFTDSFLPPAGVPIYGFGAMLTMAFVVTAMLWGPGRAQKVGLSKDRLYDFAIILFVTGIAGARVVYMLQYSDQFPPFGVEWLKAFFQIWNGGIVVYGAVAGGLLGYAAFYWYVLRRARVSGWKLADVVAPLIAAGMATGRIGCYLNGCCWGQPVATECQPVPLDARLGQFPLVPAHSRDQVCRPAGADDRMPQIRGLQTSTGFGTAPRAKLGAGDPRTVVTAVEPGSEAKAAGLQPGDRVVELNGRPNAIVVELTGTRDAVDAAATKLTSAGGTLRPPGKLPDALAGARVAFDTPEAYQAASVETVAAGGVTATVADDLTDLVRDPPRDRAALVLGVLRGGATVPVTFTPRTVPYFPTQLYEVVSMGLLILVLVTFQPLRRHDGQVMVLLMLGYAGHRFLNESLRIEPTYGFGLTLSQYISIGIFAAGLALDGYLRLTMPKLPAGPLPLGYGATAVAGADAA